MHQKKPKSFLQAVEIERLASKNKFLQSKYSYLERTSTDFNHPNNNLKNSDTIEYDSEEVFQYHELLEKYKNALTQIDSLLGENQQLKKNALVLQSFEKNMEKKNSKQETSNKDLSKQLENLKIKYINQEQIVQQLSNRVKQDKILNDSLKQNQLNFKTQIEELTHTLQKLSHQKYESFILEIIFQEMNQIVSEYCGINKSLLETMLTTVNMRYKNDNNNKEEIRGVMKKELLNLKLILKEKQGEDKRQAIHEAEKNTFQPKFLQKEITIRQMQRKINNLKKIYDLFGKNGIIKKGDYMQNEDLLISDNKLDISNNSSQRSAGKIVKRNNLQTQAYKQEIKRLKQQNEKLLYEIAQTKIKRKYKHEEIEQVYALKEEKQVLTQQLEEKNEKILQLTQKYRKQDRQLSKLKQKLQQAKSQLEQQKDKNQKRQEKHRQQLKKYEKQIKSLKRENNKDADKLNIKNSMRELLQKCQVLQQKNEQLEERCTNLQKLKYKLESENKRYARELKNSKLKRNQDNSYYSDFEERRSIQFDDQKYEQLQRQFKLLKDRYQQIAFENQKLQRANQELLNQNQIINQKISKKQTNQSESSDKRLKSERKQLQKYYQRLLKLKQDEKTQLSYELQQLKKNKKISKLIKPNNQYFTARHTSHEIQQQFYKQKQEEMKQQNITLLKVWEQKKKEYEMRVKNMEIILLQLTESLSFLRISQ